MQKFTSFVLACSCLVSALATAQTSSTDTAAENGLIDNGVILLYHHVDSQTPPSTSVSKERFREHMTYLSENFNVIPLPEMIESLRQGKPIPDKSVAITFDDGYENIFLNAHPILREFGFPYTVFISPSLIGNEPQQLNWQQIKQMHFEGTVFANHSNEHDHLLTKLPDESENQWLERVVGNIEAAQDKLVLQLEEVPRYIAYPYGEYNLALAERLRELGYIGFGQHSGAVASHSDFTALPRFAAAGVYSNLKTLQVKLNTLAMPVTSKTLDDPHLSFDYRQPIQELTLDTRDFSIDRVNCFYEGNAMEVGKTENKINISLNEPMNIGRSRINCTALSKTRPGRYYWYSQPWFVAREDGSWLD